MLNTIEKHWPFYLGILCVVVFFLVDTSPANFTMGDAHGSLLTAQAILEHHTIRLDAYRDRISGYTFGEVNGHLYYNYPLGTSLFALPVVWAMNLRGEQFWAASAETDVQKPFAATTVAILCILTFFLCRYYLSLSTSLFLTVLLILGSAFASTLGSALWSMNLEIVFIMAFLLVLVYRQNEQTSVAYGFILGLLGFAAFLCRPTALTFLFPTAVYLLYRDWRVFVRFILALGILLGILVTFSFSEFGTLLPAYYQGSAFNGSPQPPAPLGLKVYGLLFSPSRGLFVFQPYLLVAVIAAILLFNLLRRRPLFWLASAWALLHLALLMSFPTWWGGASFGSRLFTDSLPALFVLTILAWEQMSRVRLAIRRTFQGSFIALGWFAIFIHVSQGLFNPYASAWSSFPNVDLNVSYLLDWRFPEFLASPQQQRDRLFDYQFNRLTVVRLDEVIKADSTSLIFDNWSNYLENYGRQDIYRSSQDMLSTIYFQFSTWDPLPRTPLYLKLRGIADQGLSVDLSLNGTPIGHVDGLTFAPRDYSFEVNTALFKPTGELNRLDFSMPNAAFDQGDNASAGISGFGFISLQWATQP